MNISGSQPGMSSGPLDSFNAGASGSSSGLGGGLSALQRQFLSKSLMGMGGNHQRSGTPMLNLGNVQGNLPGAGVWSPYGVV
jgi:hypothetical protein